MGGGPQPSHNTYKQSLGGSATAVCQLYNKQFSATLCRPRVPRVVPGTTRPAKLTKTFPISLLLPLPPPLPSPPIGPAPSACLVPDPVRHKSLVSVCLSHQSSLPSICFLSFIVISGINLSLSNYCRFSVSFIKTW